MNSGQKQRFRQTVHSSRGPIALGAWALGTLSLVLLGHGPGSPAVLWPSLVAVALAFITREIYSSLFLGALAGAILLQRAEGQGLLEATFFGWIDLFSVHMLGALTSRWNISILTFTLMMGGLVELLHRNGSMQSLANLMLGSGRSSRRAAMSAFGMGWLVFFDGLANSMLVGKTMRATADRAGLSREKLAFIVDSTSSPIASVALVSTWIVTEMSLIREGLEHLPSAAGSLSPYGLLIQSLPYRFYAYFLLVMVFASIWQQRDFGPMVQAERRAHAEREQSLAAAQKEPVSAPGKIWLAIAPLAILIFGVFGGLYVQGGGLQQQPSLQNAIEALGRAEADVIFVCACASAVLVAILLSWLGGGKRSDRNQAKNRAEDEGEVQIFFGGMKQMFLPVLILVFAWTLNSVIVKLGAATYLVQTLEGNFPVALLPAAVFVLAALISFSTGTSWGTMGIVLPLVIPIAAELAGDSLSPILPASIGAVLAGSVFGDHCSPISDTTLVSAFASGCEPMDHVRTQIPYALVVAAVAIGLGYVPAALGVSAWVLLPAGALACWLFVRVLGKKIDAVRAPGSR